MFFQSWQTIGRVLLVGAAAYIALVFMLRLSGARTLSKLNAFDLVVTVALGSTLASTLLPSSVTLADGIAGLMVLILLQYALAWTVSRSRLLEKIAKNEPAMLVHRGRLLTGPMRKERITATDVRSAVRGAGYEMLSQIEAVVLESSGDLHVIPATRASNGPVEGRAETTPPASSR